MLHPHSFDALTENGSSAYWKSGERDVGVVNCQLRETIHAVCVMSHLCYCSYQWIEFLDDMRS